MVKNVLRNSSQYTELSFLQRSTVSEALFQPYLTRTLTTGEAKPPAEHFGEALKRIGRSSDVTDDPALQEYRRTNVALQGEHASLVEELRPQVEKDLLAASETLFVEDRKTGEEEVRSEDIAGQDKIDQDQSGQDTAS